MHVRLRTVSLAALTLLVAIACASSSRQVPYPAFKQVGEVEGGFLAGLPQIRARPLSGDARSERLTALLTLPAEWRWTTGAAPGKSVEIYVLAGELLLGDLTLRSGNYAYLPPGSMGLSMSTEAGAELLYFLDEANRDAVIQTPLFMSRDVVPWETLAGGSTIAGSAMKVLRSDPGSGARTWLQRTAPGDTLPWQANPMLEEGFLLSGDYRHSECVNGEAVAGEYAAGGYFRRPAGAVSGGPAAGSSSGAVWLMRRSGGGTIEAVDGCTAAAGTGKE